MKDIQNQLHQVLAEELLARVQTGEATASELNVARQFLKDNPETAAAIEKVLREKLLPPKKAAAEAAEAAEA